MPVSLIPKRQFLKSIAAATSVLIPSFVQGNENPATSWYALMADTHIDANPETIARGTNMSANLTRAVTEILAEPTAPSFAVINGDCSYLKGLPADYKTLRPLVQPLLDRGIPVHLTMGNHDDRAPFFGMFPEAKNDGPLPQHLTVIETAEVNWFLLDTLKEVNVVTGEVGEAQREWLAAELDKRSEKPAIIIGHHYPQNMPEGSTARVSGLADTVAFMELLRAKSQAKAYLFGHSHNYGFKQVEGGMHLINQPPVAYLFNEKHANGWLKVQARADQLITELRAFDHEHPQHGEVKTLAYR